MLLCLGGKDKITLKPYVVGATKYYIHVRALLYGEGSGGDQGECGCLSCSARPRHGTGPIRFGPATGLATLAVVRVRCSLLLSSDLACFAIRVWGARRDHSPEGPAVATVGLDFRAFAKTVHVLHVLPCIADQHIPARIPWMCRTAASRALSLATRAGTPVAPARDRLDRTGLWTSVLGVASALGVAAVELFFPFAGCWARLARP